MYDHEEISLIEQMLPLLNTEDNVSGNEFYDTARQIKKFLDSLPGGFLIYNADGNEEIIYANRALIRMFKCDTFEEFKEYTGNSFKGIVYHEDLEEVEKSIEEQIENSHDDLDYVEYRILCKDGTVKRVEDYGHFIRTQSAGNIYYVFITDSTEKINRRISERNALINENEKKLQNLIEQYDKERMLIRQEHLQRLEVIEGLSVNYDSILYTDIDANFVMPYRLSSRLKKQFERTLQTREYLWFVNDYVNCWVHPDDRANVSEMLTPDYIRNKLNDNSTFYLNFRCIQNNETQYLQLRLVDVSKSEHVSQIVMGFRNIDKEVLQEMEKKKLLEEALNNAKLAYVAKNSFLSNMSHDMRTPLNAIFGYTALASKNLHDKNTVREYLDKIDTAGRQILDLVEKVLEISYTESQDFHINESECNLIDTVREIYDYLLPQTQSKNIDFNLRTDAVKHSYVFADGAKIKQVLKHIAGNAVKFTGKGGKISITVSEQQQASDKFAVYRFTVKDTGTGISKENLQRIFEPFEREKNTTHSGVFGSGLGLTIAKHIIEMMGGTIEADSEIGAGSAFTVTLSFKPVILSDGNENSAEDIIKKLKGKKILLVEDNEINLEIETEMLQDLGLLIDTAENGKIAVDKVKKAKPDEYLFVLMDIQMPVMDGRQAAEAIRKLENNKLANIPIIALSANAFESDKRMSIEAGMNEHLTKPIDIPLLLKTLAKTLNI